MAKIQIINGTFQDAEGNVLANGYLTMQLNQDCVVSATGQVCAGIIVTVPLDANGNVSGTVLVWPNDQLNPSNSYYTVTGYTANGQLAWGPNIQQITGAGPFNLDAWVPNTVTNWTPSINILNLQTNGVNNGSQQTLDLVAGSHITLTDDRAGNVTVAAAWPTLPTFQTNDVNNGSQTLLDLKAGSNITLTEDGAGHVTITSIPTVIPADMMAWDKIWAMIRYNTNDGSNGMNTQTMGTIWTVGSTGASGGVNSFLGNSNYPSGGLVTTGGVTAGAQTFSQMKIGGTTAYSKLVTAFAYAGAFSMTLGTNCYYSPLALVTQGFGVWNSPPSSTTDFNAANIIAIYSVGGNWLCICRSGSVNTIVDSGVAVDGNPHRFYINNNSGTINFVMDSTTLANISTNVPASGLFSLETAVQNLSGITAASQGFIGIQYLMMSW